MAKPFEIREVDGSRDRAEFISLPWRINRRDPAWVPPLRMSVRQILDTARHPFWEGYEGRFFLAETGNETVGRVAAIWKSGASRSYTEQPNDEAGYFGFLEFAEDQAVLNALMDAVAAILRRQGFPRMLGPVNPSTNYELGFLVDGFEHPPYFMLTHNPPYYDRMMVEAGCGKVRDFYSYILTGSEFNPSDKQRRVAERLRERMQVTVRTVDLRRFDREVALVGDLYNDAWAGHWGFQPMTPAEFVQMGKDLRAIVDPELIFFIEYRGEPVGFVMALPNYNEVFARIRDGRLWPFGIFKLLYFRKKIKTARVITLGIRRQYQHLGLASIAYPLIAERLVRRGYPTAEASWVVEDNGPMNSAARQIGARVYKTYRLYERLL